MTDRALVLESLWGASMYVRRVRAGSTLACLLLVQRTEVYHKACMYLPQSSHQAGSCSVPQRIRAVEHKTRQKSVTCAATLSHVGSQVSGGGMTSVKGIGKAE